MALPISLEKLNNKFTISRANNSSRASGLMRAKPCYGSTYVSIILHPFNTISHSITNKTNGSINVLGCSLLNFLMKRAEWGVL